MRLFHPRFMFLLYTLYRILTRSPSFCEKSRGLIPPSLHPSLDVASKGDSNNSSFLVVLLPRVGAVGRLALAMLQELAYRKPIKVRNGCRVVRQSGADTASIRQESSASPHGSVRLAVVCD